MGFRITLTMIILNLYKPKLSQVDYSGTCLIITFENSVTLMHVKYLTLLPRMYDLLIHYFYNKK